MGSRPLFSSLCISCYSDTYVYVCVDISHLAMNSSCPTVRIRIFSFCNNGDVIIHESILGGQESNLINLFREKVQPLY